MKKLKDKLKRAGVALGVALATFGAVDAKADEPIVFGNREPAKIEHRLSEKQNLENKIQSIYFPNSNKVKPKTINADSEESGFGFKDVAAIGAAYIPHLILHEIGHQVVAEDVGADSPKISFFTRKNGKLYPGLSTYESIPKESKLPYAVGGEWMAGYTFEYALQSYRDKPTTFNKALMFFGCADFLSYTLLANYTHSDNVMYDPNLIREETGLSKEALLSFVTAKTLMNIYRVFNENANFAPVIMVDKDSAAFMVQFQF